MPQAVPLARMHLCAKGPFCYLFSQASASLVLAMEVTSHLLLGACSLIAHIGA